MKKLIASFLVLLYSLSANALWFDSPREPIPLPDQSWQYIAKDIYANESTFVPFADHFGFFILMRTDAPDNSSYNVQAIKINCKKHTISYIYILAVGGTSANGFALQAKDIDDVNRMVPSERQIAPKSTNDLIRKKYCQITKEMRQSAGFNE